MLDRLAFREGAAALNERCSSTTYFGRVWWEVMVLKFYTKETVTEKNLTPGAILLTTGGEDLKYSD